MKEIISKYQRLFKFEPDQIGYRWLSDMAEEIATLKNSSSGGERTTNTQKPSASQIAADIEKWANYRRDSGNAAAEITLREWAQQLRLL